MEKYKKKILFCLTLMIWARGSYGEIVQYIPLYCVHLYTEQVWYTS